MSCNQCLMDGSNPLETLQCCASHVQLQDTCLCYNVLWCATLFHGPTLFHSKHTPHCWNESYNKVSASNVRFMIVLKKQKQKLFKCIKFKHIIGYSFVVKFGKLITRYKIQLDQILQIHHENKIK